MVALVQGTGAPGAERCWEAWTASGSKVKSSDNPQTGDFSVQGNIEQKFH